MPVARAKFARDDATMDGRQFEKACDPTVRNECDWSRKVLIRRDQQGVVLLVAITSADGNFVTALGAAPAKHGCTSLGLHTSKKPVGLRPVAAVGLKGTLRHLTRLLLISLCGLQQSLSIPEMADLPKPIRERKVRSLDHKQVSNRYRTVMLYVTANQSSQGMVQ